MKHCLSCGMDLNDPDAKPSHPTDIEGREVCNFCWNEYRLDRQT
jgi:hypothetical protein